MVTQSQQAPGNLEQARDLLNSWLIPTDVRVPEDRFDAYVRARNGTKRWCLMNAGSPAARACGTNAKVRRFRERQRADGE